MNLEKKSQYEAILDAIRSILRNPEYSEQFRSDLESVLQEGETTLDIVSKRVSDLHVTMNRNPLVIEAESLYKDFPIEKVRNELIEDYISMEMASRRGDLKYYFLALYQQFENLTNAIFNNYYDTFAKFYEENKFDLLKSGEKTTRLIEFIMTNYLKNGSSNDNLPFEQLVTGIPDKFRLISYYLNPNIDFLETRDQIKELSDLRNNSTHRFTVNDYQKKIFQNALSRPLFYKIYHIRQLQEFAALACKLYNGNTSRSIQTTKKVLSNYCYVAVPNLIEMYEFNINWNTLNIEQDSSNGTFEMLTKENKKLTVNLDQSLINEIVEKQANQFQFSIEQYIKAFCSLYISLNKDENVTCRLKLNKNNTSYHLMPNKKKTGEYLEVEKNLVKILEKGI